MESKEIWKDIKDFEGIYQVSNLGRVRGLDRIVVNVNGKRNSIKGRIIKPITRQTGYVVYGLNKGGKAYKRYAHRLVAQAFIPNPNNYPEVNHINEFNKSDNSVDNLEWCTRDYNSHYGTRSERAHKTQSRIVLATDIRTGVAKPFSTYTECAMYYKIGNLGEKIRSKKICKGHTFKYLVLNKEESYAHNRMVQKVRKIIHDNRKVIR